MCLNFRAFLSTSFSQSALNSTTSEFCAILKPILSCAPHWPCYLPDPTRLWGPPAACALVVAISKCHPLNPCCCIIVIYDLQLLMHSQVLLAIIIPVCEAKVTASVSYGCLAGLWQMPPLCRRGNSFWQRATAVDTSWCLRLMGKCFSSDNRGLVFNARAAGTSASTAVWAASIRQ